jgi:RNA polymerase sigma-70 factor, ECF subfamily
MNDLPADAIRNERFMRLYVTHEPQILCAIMVLVPQASDARDVLQETAVLLWQRFDTYDTNRPFVNWALGYARNFIRRHFRNLERGRRLSDAAVEALLIAAEPRQAAAEQRAEALEACLREAPAASRAILEGYYFQHRTVEELGALYAKSAEAIYKIIQRLRMSLLDCVNQKLNPAASQPS